MSVSHVPVYALDTNLVGDASEAVLRLQRRHEAGQIVLVRSDTVETELIAAGEDCRDRLLRQARCYEELLGALVLDHSRLGAFSLGSDSDAARFVEVFGHLFPQTDRQSARKQKVRDAMHVATALSHGLNGFITRDHGPLKATARLSEAFPWFSVLTPEELDDALDREPPS